MLVTAVGSRPKTVDVRSELQASSCGTGPLRLALPDPSTDMRILHAVGRRDGSVSYVEEGS